MSSELAKNALKTNRDLGDRQLLLTSDLMIDKRRLTISNIADAFGLAQKHFEECFVS